MHVLIFKVVQGGGPFLYQTKQQTCNEIRQMSLPNVKPTGAAHFHLFKAITLSKKKKMANNLVCSCILSGSNTA